MCNVINFRQALHNSRLFHGVISEPSEFVLIDQLVSISDAILSMVNIAANMLGAKTEENAEAEGIYF